jgi:hypothetical protein
LLYSTLFQELLSKKTPTTLLLTLIFESFNGC